MSNGKSVLRVEKNFAVHLTRVGDLNFEALRGLRVL